MSPAWIRTRALTVTRKNPKGGVSYQVLFRRGGRGYPIESAGTFRTQKDARARRDLVSGWLAAGLNPHVELEKAVAQPVARLTVAQWGERYRASRLDHADETAKGVGSCLKKLNGTDLAKKQPGQVTVDDVVELVADWHTTLMPSSIGRYMATVRLILDYAGVDPNPARDKRVKLPKVEKREADPPTADEFLAMLRAMPRRYWLPVVTLEQTGMRVGECASLTWADVDERGARFRLRSVNVKTSAARWVAVPAWLMALVAAQLPREDRSDSRNVFAGFTGDAAKNAMARACRGAGIPLYSPHDLRHRRGTLWHHDPAVSIREQMDMGGWTKSQVAIDTYSHVQRLDEIPQDVLERLLVMTP